MSNALTGFRDLFLPKNQDQVKTATVLTVSGNKCTVLTTDGVQKTAWGSGYKVNDEVLVLGDQLLGKVLVESEIVVYIT